MEIEQEIIERNKVIAEFKMNLIVTKNNDGTRSSFVFIIEINDGNGMAKIETKKDLNKINEVLNSNIIAVEQFDICVLFKITNKMKKKFFSKSGIWNLKKMSEIVQKRVLKIKNLRNFYKDYCIVLNQDNIFEGEISLIRR